MVYRKADGTPVTTSDLDLVPRALPIGSANVPVRKALSVTPVVPPPAVTTGPATLPVATGIVTSFATPKDLATFAAIKKAGGSDEKALLKGDNGIGAKDLGYVSTPNAYGVAIPEDQLRARFGDNPDDWRTARAQLTIGDKMVQVPIIDLGPGAKPQARGVVTDASHPLATAMGIKPDDEANGSVALVANAGPDYIKNPTEWNNEQDKIASSLGVQPVVSASPAPTPSVTLPNSSSVAIANANDSDKQRGLMNM
jgi:hypothetical protein